MKKSIFVIKYFIMAGEIKKIYDIKTIGVVKVLNDLKMVNDQLEKIKQTKQKLNQDKTDVMNPANVVKYNTELAKQSVIEEKLAAQKIKNQQEIIKLGALQAKQEAARIKAAADAAKKTSSPSFTSNVDSSGKIIQPKTVKDATTAVSQLDEQMLDAQLTATEWAKSMKTVDTNTQNVTKSVADNSKELELNKKIAIETKYLAGEQTRLLKAQVREENNAKGSLEQRRAALIRLNAVYDKLSPKERDTSWGIKLKTVLGSLTDQVKALESTTGRDQRNVGNYASAFDGVAEKAGKAYGVLRTVANILPGFGIGGLVGLGVEGLLALADAMHLLENVTKEESDQIKFFNEQQKKIISTVAEETAILRTNYETAINTNLSYKERGEAVDELVKQYPEYFGNINREKLLNGELTDTYNLLTSSIQKRAEAQAKQNLLVTLYEKRVAAQMKLDKLTAQNNNGEFYYSQETREALQGVVDTIDSEINSVEKSIQTNKEKFGNDIYYINETVKKRIEAQQKIDQSRAINGEPSKSKKKTSNGDDLDDQKEADKKALEQQKVLNDARLSLMDDHAREIEQRTQQYYDDVMKLDGASDAERELVYNAYQKNINEINGKYAAAAIKEMQSRNDEKQKAQEKAWADESEATQNEHEENLKWEAQFYKDLDETESQARELKKQKDAAAAAEEKRLRREAMDGALQLSREFAQSQIDLENQQIEARYKNAAEYNNTEKQKRLSQATSKAEEQAIESEFNAKQKEADLQRNKERQETARKLLTIEFALASIKAISTSTTIYEGLIKEGIVLGEYLIALNNLNSQKFEDGGSVPTSTGGDITGASHAAGGVPFGFEAEGGEMAIINKRSTMDSGTYSVTGTPREIASAINEIGGGVRFAPGANMRKFEYGGMLGSNIPAPILRGYQSGSSSSGSNDSDLILQSIISTNQRIDNMVVVLDPKGVKNANDKYSRQKSVGIV